MSKIQFELDEGQTARALAWVAEQNAAERAVQVKNCNDCNGTPSCLRHLSGPYHGACGGAVTYSFTPTSLGWVVKVRHDGTKQELDVSDYDSW